jgi:hypothetical protein
VVERKAPSTWIVNLAGTCIGAAVGVRQERELGRAMLADDVRLNQATHPVRVGAADVGMFFISYAKIAAVWLVPAWLEGQEVIAVFESRLEVRPSYSM